MPKHDLIPYLTKAREITKPYLLSASGVEERLAKVHSFNLNQKGPTENLIHEPLEDAQSSGEQKTNVVGRTRGKPYLTRFRFRDVRRQT
ncbi:hypothetical protein Hdeb2414_s0027g00689891 [Helianthus debilis subsp. tardiflorus]